MLAAAASPALSLVPALADAGEAQLDASTDAVASTWRGDFGGGGRLRFGYRFSKIVAVDLVGWEHLMAVDTRLDTGLTLGVTGFLPLGTVRPSLRVYAIHQHEEGLVSFENEPGGAIFGIGAGIRHRAGGGLAPGIEVSLDQSKELEWLFLASLDATWFPDNTLGPSAYFGLNLGLGLNYSIPGLP